MTVQAYIASFPEAVQSILTQVRQLILAEAPDVVESFAYQMPAYKTHGKPLVYFACFKQHLGLYATPTAHSAFAEELAAYKQGKGSVQFPLNKPIPYELIARLVAFKVKENEKHKKD